MRQGGTRRDERNRQSAARHASARTAGRCGAVALLLAMSVGVASAQVMSLRGTFSVRATAGAGYIIAIAVPPGTAGMAPNGAKLNQTINNHGSTNLGGTRSQVFLNQNVASSIDLDGSVMPAITTTYQYDAFGNAAQLAVSTPDGASKTTTNTDTNDTTNWYLGRLTGATVTSTLP